MFEYVGRLVKGYTEPLFLFRLFLYRQLVFPRKGGQVS